MVGRKRESKENVGEKNGEIVKIMFFGKRKKRIDEKSEEKIESGAHQILRSPIWRKNERKCSTIWTQETNINLSLISK